MRRATLALALALSGCTAAQSRAIAPAVEQAACTLVAIVSHNASAGVTCSDLAPLAQGIVDSLTPSPPVAMAARECKLAPVIRGAEVRGYLCAEFASEVNAHLAGNPAALKVKR